MRKRVPAAVLAALLLLALCRASAVAGSAQDPVVTRAYMTGVFMPDMLKKAESAAQAAVNRALAQLEENLDALTGSSGIYAGLYLQAAASGGVELSNRAGTKTLAQGSLITGVPGTTLILLSGTATVYAPKGGVLVNLTTGTELRAGESLSAYAQYMIADTAAIGVRVSSSEARFSLSSGYGILHTAAGASSGTYRPVYEKYARALQTMQLFRGTDSGFELDRAATRTEALVMLVRIMGEEAQALSYAGKHPFKDVPAWADRYVAYAYNRGYTRGVSATSFGAQDHVTEAQYLTFLLRTLGYDDAAGDFDWERAPEKAVSVGILSTAQEKALRPLFYRDHVVFTSYLALYAPLKDSGARLIDRLIGQGAVTVETATQAATIVG